MDKSESTVSAYYYRLKHFIEWAEDKQIESMRELTGWNIDSYETFRRQQGLKPVSLNNEMGTLKSFFEYCARIEVADEDLPKKVDVPDVDSSQQVSDSRLTTTEAQTLLEYYKNDSENYASRAHALLATAWYTGARLGALRGLDVSDYDPEERCLQFMHRPHEDTPLKNGTDGERIVGLPEQVCTILDEYIRVNRHEKFDDYGRRPLFASEVGRASTNAVRAWMYFATVPCLHSDCPHGNDRATCEYLDYSSISKCPSSVNPHAVRTGSITWQLNQGIPRNVSRSESTLRSMCCLDTTISRPEWRKCESEDAHTSIG
ncbi:site-specific integrase [Natrinema sp. 1APR25-10V2]|uniref:tyrosine-type recombinase/integrase n=1 Tax=Natrinema sp. 1APR25-10V2 TaxID=2951081 RepID=UPI002876F49E|nr:site-specific integrase [Natrinema sp. 1APR25-10V2]MDS0475957.1 site-specific integrase [Natrinema sp. 1APR25-10V2]